MSLKWLAILESKAEGIAESARTLKFLSPKRGAPLPYAYPCDNYMDAILSNKLVRRALLLFADKYCKEQIQNVRLEGRLVDESNHPRLYGVLQDCCKSLNVEQVPAVYVTNRLRGINALSVGTDNAPIVLVSRKTVVGLSDGELSFVIGHELGHILQKNMMCHTIKGLLDRLNNKSEMLGSVVSDSIDVPLNEWYRCAEYTADRAGYLCCKDVNLIEGLFDKIFERSSIVGHQSFIELYQHHPFIRSRLDNIKEFAKTN